MEGLDVKIDAVVVFCREITRLFVGDRATAALYPDGTIQYFPAQEALQVGSDNFLSED